MDRQLRVTDDVCEQDMRDLELDLFLNFGGHVYFTAPDVSFWKRGSLRSGSNIGSSRSSAGVSGEFVRKVFALLFRRERGDDFLKARIAAKCVPEGHQF